MHSAFAAALAFTALAIAAPQEKKRFAYPQPASQEEAMARWQKACQPSAAHDRLKELLGQYDLTMRMMMGGPGTEPVESKGTGETSWLAEGRWLQSKWTMDMMGQKVTGTWILGYDNFKERYVYCTVDSLQTCMNNASGLFDQKGDHLILWGTIDEPLTPEQDKMVKYVFRDFGKDKSIFEVHDMMIGEANTKVVEIESVRKK